MHPGWKILLGVALVAPGVFLIEGRRPSYGDEPVGRFGRFFRFGGASSGPTPPPGPESTTPPQVGDPLPPSSMLGAPPQSSGLGPRLIPQPRVSRSVTDADPLVTRIALARSNDGSPFGMFLQVFADGTVIDSEGMHHLGPADLKPVFDVLATNELYRLKGHCGAPATDFIEQVHVIAFERSLGRLRAHSFSYSGNPQGCDQAVQRLHAALDGLQAKLSRPMTTSSPAFGPVPVPVAPPANAGATTIPLTPVD